MNKKFLFISLISLGLITSGAAYFSLVGNMEEVIVATDTLRGNSKISNTQLTTKKVDKESIPANYIPVDKYDDVVNSYTNIGITKGSIFTYDNIATKTNKKSAIIPEGYTLLSITFDNIPQGVESDDHINLLIGANIQDDGKVVMTYQNILVTSTYKDADGKVIGLEVQVTPKQAQQIQYAQLNGTISATLLPLGYYDVNLPITNEDNIKRFESSSNDESNYEMTPSYDKDSKKNKD